MLLGRPYPRSNVDQPGSSALAHGSVRTGPQYLGEVAYHLARSIGESTHVHNFSQIGADVTLFCVGLLF